MASAARGKGPLPLKDGARKGSLSAFGANIAIGKTTRHAGEFEVLNLEGRFDLADLVDPNVKDPKAADRARIKALVRLTGAVADPDAFLRNSSLYDPDKFIAQESLDADDLLLMARNVKRNYEQAARNAEEEADRLQGREEACREFAKGVDLEVETDTIKLMHDVAEANAAAIALKERADKSQERLDAKKQADHILATITDEYDADKHDALRVHIQSKNENIKALRDKLAETEHAIEAETARLREMENDLSVMDERELSITRAKEIIENLEDVRPVDKDELRAADKAIEDANNAVQLGGKARDAKEQLDLAAQYIDQQRLLDEEIGKLRYSAGAVDSSISAAVQCESLQFETEDGDPRLFFQHPERGKTPYHELSDGERWRIAIDLGADQVGRGGLLVIPQTAWESLDAFVRPDVHEHAKRREVYILTAEAAREPDEGRTLAASAYPTP